MTTGYYCLDANVFITAWNTDYPLKIFPSLWEEISGNQNRMILLRPIYEEIDPPASNKPASNKPGGLHQWLMDHNFQPAPVDGATQKLSCELETKYEIKKPSKGASQNDITLIAYAKKNQHTVVTLEALQTTTPGEKCNYKIPLICKEENVPCITFIPMLGALGIKI